MVHEMHSQEVPLQFGIGAETFVALGAAKWSLLFVVARRRVIPQVCQSGEQASALSVHAVQESRRHQKVSVDVSCQKQLGLHNLAAVFALVRRRQRLFLNSNSILVLLNVHFKFTLREGFVAVCVQAVENSIDWSFVSLQV
jgi:hypothetical protein